MKYVKEFGIPALVTLVTLYAASRAFGAKTLSGLGMQPAPGNTKQ